MSISKTVTTDEWCLVISTAGVHDFHARCSHQNGRDGDRNNINAALLLSRTAGTRLPVPYTPHDCARKAALTSQHPCYLGEIFVAPLLDDIRIPMMSSLLKTRIHMPALRRSEGKGNTNTTVNIIRPLFWPSIRPDGVNQSSVIVPVHLGSTSLFFPYL